jgi:hypothetical protein
MSARTIANCSVIKSGLRLGIGRPLTEKVNDKEYCQGYQKSDDDDEPYEGCMNCKLNIFYFESEVDHD